MEIPVSAGLGQVMLQPGQEFAFMPLRWGLDGSLYFSPGGDRLVYGMFLGIPDQQSSAVAISDGINGASKVIANNEEPGFFALLA